jgi:hypothetical protein
MYIFTTIIIAGIVGALRLYRREVRERRARQYPKYRQRWRLENE